MKQTMTLAQAVDKVVKNMSGVMSRQEIVDAVLRDFPSKAKDPASSITTKLKWHPEVVVLGNGRYARTDYVLEGIKFRVRPTAYEIADGILNSSWFTPFDQVMPPLKSTFVTGGGDLIPIVTKVLDPAKLTDEQLRSILPALEQDFLVHSSAELLSDMAMFDELDEKDQKLLDTEDDEDWELEYDLEDDDEDWEFDENEDEDLSEEEMINQLREHLKAQGKQEFQAHDFSAFFRANQVKQGDSLIVTMSPAKGAYIFEHEPASKAQEILIKQRDREISQLIHKAVNRDRRINARDFIFQICGNLDWVKEYPSSHWMEIVDRDDQLRLIDLLGGKPEIASIDYHMLFDMLGVDEKTKHKQRNRVLTLEQEINDFCARFEDEYTAATDELKGEYDDGGTANVINPDRKLYQREAFSLFDEDWEDDGIDDEDFEEGLGEENNGHFGRIGLDEMEDEDSDMEAEEEISGEEIFDHNTELIGRFFAAQKKKKGGTSLARRKASDVALFADFLARYHDCALEYACLDSLEEFLFSWYPRKVLNSTASDARQIALSLREFYQFLVESNIIRSAKFAEAIYKLRNLAAEKVELYDRLPSGKDFQKLFERLFGWEL